MLLLLLKECFKKSSINILQFFRQKGVPPGRMQKVHEAGNIYKRIKDRKHKIMKRYVSSSLSAFL